MQLYKSISMMLLLMVCCGALAMGVTILLTPLAARLAHRAGALAIPRSRDVHSEPVPRWGGLAIFFGFLLSTGCFVLCVPLLKFRLSGATLLEGAGIIAGGALVSLVGAVDDRKDLSPLPRLAAQVGAGMVAYAVGVRIEILTLPFSQHPINTHWLSAPITIFWLLLVMNAINWLDGLDGLAAGVCSIIATFLAFLALASHQVCLAALCVALAGSTLGFLRYNYAPARIYMGGGAEFLGFVLATVSIAGAFKQVTTVAIVLPVMAMAVPLLDSVNVVVRRAASGEPVYQADRRHFHHALIDLGLTKKQAALVLNLITLTLCIAAWTLFRHSPAPAHASLHPRSQFSKSSKPASPHTPATTPRLPVIRHQ